MNRPVTFERPTLYEAEAIQAEIDRIENLAFWYRKQARNARVRAWFSRLIASDVFYLILGAELATVVGLILMVWS
jgi:hypothetical protein